MDFTPCKSLHNEDLEITRNPFDSKDFDKENCPAFSPSIFVKSVREEDSGKKSKEFRWSIDQMAVLKPVDIEQYPYQEYSASYEREEDEIAAQKAINEYFSNVLLPSPWMRNKNQAFKRVTFSPHPPTYFKETPETSKASINSENENSRKMVDGSCQTTLTIPPNVDIEKLLGNAFFTYQDETIPSNNKELNVSTLRRKLFSQGESPLVKDHSIRNHNHDDGDDNLCVEIKGLVSASSTPRTPKTPKTPKTPNWITSSPFRDTTPSNRMSSSHDSVLQSSFVAEPFLSPSVSPIKFDNDPNNNEASTFELSDEAFTSIMGVTCTTSSSLPLENSKQNIAATSSPESKVSDDNNDDDTENYGRLMHLQSGRNIPSIEPIDTSIINIKESTRNSPIHITGVSPIRNDNTRGDAMDMSMISSTRLYGTTANISELPDISQSVKESTARHLHGMTGLFSPISGTKNAKESKIIADLGDGIVCNEEDHDVSFDDGGPLDITDLSSPEQLGGHFDASEDDEDVCQSDDVYKPPLVIVSPFPTPKRGILKKHPKRLSPLPGKPGREESQGDEKMDHRTVKDRFRNLETKLIEVESRLENVEYQSRDNEKYPLGKETVIKTPTTGVQLNSVVATKDTALCCQDQRKPMLEDRSAGMVGPAVRRSDIDGEQDNNIGDRLPLRDVSNMKPDCQCRHQSAARGKEERHFDVDSVVLRADAALSKAKKIQSCVDGDFELFLESSPRADVQRNDEIAREEDESRASCEVAGIMQHCMDQPQSQYDQPTRLAALQGDRFHEYRLAGVRDSLNDSLDVRSPMNLELTGDIDNSMLTAVRSRDTSSRVPTPVMNLAGLTIARELNTMPPHAHPTPLGAYMAKPEVAESIHLHQVDIPLFSNEKSNVQVLWPYQTRYGQQDQGRLENQALV
eukprot:gene17025-18739_t